MARLTFASAISDVSVAEDALDQIIDDLTSALPDGADLAIVFVTLEYAANLDGVRRRLEQALGVTLVLGSTCGGVVGVGREVEGGPSLSVLAAKLPDPATDGSNVTLEPFSFEQLDWARVVDDPDALREAITQSEKPRAVLLLADPFSAPMVKFLPALHDALPGVPVVGGMASAAREPGRNRLILDDRQMTEGAAGVVIGGDIAVQATLSQGCRPVGPPFVITKAKRNIVQQLGGKRALQAVREMTHTLDPADRQLIAQHGLLVGRVINEYKQHFGPGDFVVRGLIGVDHGHGYLAIGDPNIRVGQTIRFHVRDAASAADDLAMLLDAQKLHGPGAGALLFTCNGRGRKLFKRDHADASLVREALGDTPLAGFFAAGEIGPLGGESYLHGHTASLIVFRDIE